ncbi:unnamed protein product [Allacma fusca]|uniref:Solute carrier family 66 member 3 n=1 Tax=Allacma fusca TaxID=39272 RepID=A0A8J2KYQ8_9HEXA|nr:unnamed protein product [Allacma fusca]
MELLISLIVGFCDLTTIGLCFICKIPQIWTILKCKSVEGLSMPSLILEVLTYAISLCYNVMREYPLLSYMEDPFLVLQSLLVILLVYYFWGQLDIKKFGILGTSIAIFYGLTLGIPHPGILPLLLSATVPMKVFSKLMQVKEIWVRKTAGNVSLVSWIINVYTCGTRIVTTLLVTGDTTLLTKHVISMSLNCLVIATAWHFDKNKIDEKKDK